ncbi:MAG: hypothetical protein K1X72_03355 [Pyrinomonadaceae bacterium]|nr:hypothetical protein [Pyrinomonadaceae bacterium]
MQQYSINNLTVRISENINYVWVLLPEQVTREDFAAMLGNSEFHRLLQQNNVQNVLVDCGNMWNFGIPEMSDYLDKDFTVSMRQIGVKKISVVINQEVYSLLTLVFQTIENSHSQSSPQIRFFDSLQFYNSFESVSWF